MVGAGRRAVWGLLLVTAAVQQCAALTKGANNVKTIVYYVKEKYTTSCYLIGRCTRYRRGRRERYECDSGWHSDDDVACDYAICDGKTDLNGACDQHFPDSHIIYAGGQVQTNSEGSCDNPDDCTCTKTGFYTGGSVCLMCSAIANCDIEQCTTGSDQTCVQCEGVVAERAGYRAYVRSSNNRACNQACSWRSDSTRCYPGTCSNELASRCSCTSGFTGHHCHTITAKPSIDFNELKLTSSDGTLVTAPPNLNAGPSSAQNDAWTNIVDPTQLYYKMDCEFSPSSPSSQHSYVTEAKIGVIGGKIVMTSRNSQGATKGSELTRTCSGASRYSPEQNKFTCQETLTRAAIRSSLSLPLQHGDRLDFSFHADNGGYVKILNRESSVTLTHYYTGTSVSHAFQLRFDTVDPYHCTGSEACESAMQSLDDVTMAQSHTMRWSGWADDDAGLDHYKYQVYSLVYTSQQGKLQQHSIVASGTVPKTSTSTTFTTSTPDMYAVVLSAVDKAANLRSSRRLFLFDDTSVVTKDQSVTTPLRVTSAAPVTSWLWQQSEGDVTVTWTGRYSNVFHHTNHLLAAVDAAHGVDTAYDDQEGERSMAAITNVQGIVYFKTAFLTDTQGGTTLSPPPDGSFTRESGLSGTRTFSADVSDGDTMTVWVRAYDVRHEYLQESVTVHVDSSPPIIHNLWLTKDHVLNVSVHGLDDLHDMTIEWEAYDVHSGLKTVMWRVFDNFTGEDVVHGIAAVTPQGNTQTLAQCESTYGSYPRGPNCYCTGAAGCFHRHFQVAPTIINRGSNQHGGMFHDRNSATHDYDYHIEVTVYNHANLSTTLTKQITVDLSPPHVGHVHDGMSMSREVDHQSERELHALWWGFFDRESGVLFYQVAFHTQCLDRSVFGHNTEDPRVTQTYNTFASWQAPSNGTYYVTVVAFNRALEFSAPVCSDGVTVDSTRPSVTNVFVEGARIAAGVFSAYSEGQFSVWLLDRERRRRLVDSPSDQCVSEAMGDVYLLNYAESPLAGPVSGQEACSYGSLQSQFISAFYLAPTQHLFLNWTGSDAESGIYDYEVGIATTPSMEVADIAEYTSTHHHAFFRSHQLTSIEGAPFYVMIRATNKAGLTSVKSVGPVTLVRSPPSYTGTVSLTLHGAVLMVSWDTDLFSDVQPDLLQFIVALEEETEGAIIHPHTSPRFSPPCSSSSPPSCATFDLADLHWGLHERHTYRAKVTVTNIVGLDLVLTSDVYVHDTRVPGTGRVFDTVPVGEETILGVQRWEDTDYQLSTSTLQATWSGFDTGLYNVTYDVGLGTSRGTDDVSSFVTVTSATFHRFTGLQLQPDVTYYVTVVAASTAGNVTVTSDGVTVIQADHQETAIPVLDGPRCMPNTENVTWNPEHESKEVTCVDDVRYQLSTDTLQAHWTMTSQQQFRYPDVLFKVQRNVAGTVTWADVTDYSPSPHNDVIVARGLGLQSGQLYRLAVKLCVVSACTLPIFTSGVYVIANPPVTGSLAVVHSNSSGVSILTVTLEKFKDGDVSQVREAQRCVENYQWSLSHGRGSLSGVKLTSWTTVDSLQEVDDTHVSFTVTMTGELSFHKCVRLSVRGVNQVGLVTSVTTDVMDCQAVDPAPITARRVIDAVGETQPGTSSSGSPISLDQTGAWSSPDQDFTAHDDILSVVWPNIRHTRVTWAVLRSDALDVTSKYLMSGQASLRDPCSSPLQIACGTVTKQKYVNIHFGPAHSRPLLENGRHYYVCVHADAEKITHEKWPEDLLEVSDCSDGVTVDMTSPEKGRVWVDGLVNGIYQTSERVLSVRWSGFTDVEELGFAPHYTGILSYHVAVGSSRGGEEVQQFRDVGLVNSVVLHNLTMQSGHLHYVTVQARDYVGLTVTSTSQGFITDTSPPEVTSASFRFAQPYITSLSSFSVCWTDIFLDEDSSIDHYVITLGSKPGHNDVMEGQEVADDCGTFHVDKTMVIGHAYYVTVTATNGAGLQTTVTSNPAVVMTTAPASGSVFDGTPPTNGQPPVDVDFVTSPDDVRAFLFGFSSPLSPVTSYKVRLGTCPKCDDVTADFDIGVSEEVTWSHVPLHHDVKYYTTVTACNVIDQCTQVTSDGVMIDVTPPMRGVVWDGTGDEDIQYQSQRTFIGAQWRGFYDKGSGLKGFSWRAGTTPGGSDVMAERHVGVVFSAFVKDLDPPLPVDQTIYVTVVALDAAGNQQEARSNGFKVDTSGPVVDSAVHVTHGLGSVDDQGLVSRDTLGVSWAFSDPESQIASQFLSLHSHINGQFDLSTVQVPGPVTQYTLTSLSLEDGSKYKVKVTACNLAGLCTTSVSPDILHDSSPPSPGMFAVDTDHSAQLARHMDGWMEWTGASVRLAWLGFHDQHSAIDRYLVNVGSTPFSSDLNQDGSSSVVQHEISNSTGQQHEDEGFVQVYHVPTRSLLPQQHVFVTVWAVNGVGLQSHAAMSQFLLLTGGAMVLVRRCSPFNCLSHCVCAVQGAPCGAATPCTEYSEGNNPNALLTVLDQDDLSVLSSTSPVTSSSSYQASQSHLAATWRVTSSQLPQPIRFEVSAGRSDQSSPVGVFNSVTERVWRDVGLQTSSLITTPPDVKLIPNLKYSTFVRAWYGNGSYAVFKSPGITIINSGPTTTNLAGRSVKEHTAGEDTKDIDFVPSSNTVHVSWSGKFVTSSPVNRFHVFIGTQPQAGDVFTSGPLSGDQHVANISGLALREATLYYSTVTAEGSSGLVTWDVSDGFLLDTTPPVAGVVMDGSGTGDADFQSVDRTFSATWHGFYDTDSAIRRYIWCVGSSPDPDLCDVIPQTDVGLMTTIKANSGSPVSQGTTVYNKVYAEDAVGHRSEVRVSNGVKVDTTGPVPLDVVYSDGINLVLNPSFEVDTALNSNLNQCDAQPPTSWQISPGSCLTLHRPEHTVSAHGVQHVQLAGSLQQHVSGLTPGHIYRLSVRLAHPLVTATNQKPATGHVTMGTVKTAFALDPSFCRGVCDTDQEPVMLWHSFHYIATATSTTMLIAITTTNTDSDQVAIDDVTLEDIVSAGGSGHQTEAAVKVHGMFLAHWAVLQVSWHFTEDESHLVDYQWALGTSPGGVQIQGFQSVGRRQHASISGLSLTHGTHLYVTVLARNAAGLTSLTHPQPVVVDLTPPEFSYCKDGDTGDDVDYQSSYVVSARWSVIDPQSAVSSCQWAIGTLHGRGDIAPFQIAPPSDSDVFSVSTDVTSMINDVALPLKLFVNVRCYNMAGLPATTTSDGVTIISNVTSQVTTSLKLLPDGLTQYPVSGTCLAHTDLLRVSWASFVSQVPVVGFEVKTEGHSGQQSFSTPSFPYPLTSVHLTLAATPLTPHSHYTLTVHPLNALSNLGPALASRAVTVLPTSPIVNTTGTLTMSISGSDMTLSWPDLFTSDLDLSYEVTLGSVQGSSDITQWYSTRENLMVVSLARVRETLVTMYAVITAIDPCGQFAHSAHTLNLVR